MKKLLIPALLVVSAAFAPGLQDAFEFPERACEIAQEVARPLFWHLWDKLLTRELAHGISQQVTQAQSRDGNRRWVATLSSASSFTFFSGTRSMALYPPPKRIVLFLCRFRSAPFVAQ